MEFLDFPSEDKPRGEHTNRTQCIYYLMFQHKNFTRNAEGLSSVLAKILNFIQERERERGREREREEVKAGSVVILLYFP